MRAWAVAGLLFAVILAGCAPTQPLREPLLVLPCAEEIGGEIAFVYKSRGRFLMGKAACEQYFADIAEAREIRTSGTTPLTPLESMQIDRPPAGPRSEPGGPRPPTGPERPALSEFRSMAPLRPVYFDFDEAEIRPQDVPILHEYAEWIRANPTYIVVIAGHCDERGTTAYNLALGERRAARVSDYLVRRGVEATRLLTVSYGETRPVCAEATDACWALNRRAEFLLKER